uniref:Uncharacterized protein n=1 Tax=Arion vulgaris TaxID=1028688 RepID=A0A0B6ZCS7_9EUPU
MLYLPPDMNSSGGSLSQMLVCYNHCKNHEPASYYLDSSIALVEAGLELRS